MAVLMTIVGCDASLNQSNIYKHSKSVQVNFNAIDMINKSNGWAISNHMVFRTQDGGRRWKSTALNLTHSSLVSAFGYDFLNELIGFVLVNEPKGKEWLYQTKDGGHIWKKISLLPRSDVEYVKFINVNDGWILSKPAMAPGSEVAILYRTQDGGHSWTKVFPKGSIPKHMSGGVGDVGTIEFRSSKIGWISGYYNFNGGIYLLHTVDGGINWTTQNLSLPTGYKSSVLFSGTPQFFGFQNMRGVLPIWIGDTLYIFRSYDGGDHWTYVKPIQSPKVLSGVYPEFINLQDGWIWTEISSNTGADYVIIEHTTDGGMYWKTTFVGNLLNGISDISFISPLEGIALCDEGVGSKLFYTLNGGKTWTRLNFVVTTT